MREFIQSTVCPRHTTTPPPTHHQETRQPSLPVRQAEPDLQRDHASDDDDDDDDDDGDNDDDDSIT